MNQTARREQTASHLATPPSSKKSKLHTSTPPHNTNSIRVALFEFHRQSSNAKDSNYTIGRAQTEARERIDSSRSERVRERERGREREFRYYHCCFYFCSAQRNRKDSVRPQTRARVLLFFSLHAFVEARESDEIYEFYWINKTMPRARRSGYVYERRRKESGLAEFWWFGGKVSLKVWKEVFGRVYRFGFKRACIL